MLQIRTHGLGGLSCGNCVECANRCGVCPDNAVIKLGPGKRFELNQDYSATDPCSRARQNHIV